ncbi:hypothetical protein BH10PSE7_BH10PSE7_09320 [soil metagenome]
MNQSRTMSLVESVTNVVVGYVIALIIQMLVFHAMGLAVTFGENIAITLLFASVSLLRGYVVRRVFNLLQEPRP